jgi:hypothetical protein
MPEVESLDMLYEVQNNTKVEKEIKSLRSTRPGELRCQVDRDGDQRRLCRRDAKVQESR